MMTHFFSGGIQTPQERIIGRTFELRQHRPSVIDGKGDDAAWVDRLPLIHHKDVVEVQKVQRADGLQLSHVRARNARVSCDKRPKVPLA